MKINTKPAPIYNNEGVVAKRINPEMQLRRSVMACMLWENSFYEDGQTIASRIADAIKSVTPEVAQAVAVEAREDMKLRHVPLLIAREMARLPNHKGLVAETLQRIIQRPDELCEFLAIYWKDGRCKISSQVKKGLARAFVKFNEYSLAKHGSDGAIKLRDVLFLCHAKPENDEQAALWKRLIANELKTPDTWEVALSGGANKKDAFTRLIAEKKLGAMALLRNLRNMYEAGVSGCEVRVALEEMKTDRVLPFRFIAAARAVPQWEDAIEAPMLKCMEGCEKLSGTTLLLVDTSPSMAEKISSKSDLSRKDAAFALAVLIREIAQGGEIWAFSTECRPAPARRGFALADAIKGAVQSNGTLLGNAIKTVSGKYNRIIVITDEESQDRVCDPDRGTQAYLINVSSSKNGVGYGPWTHLDGWSERIIDYIIQSEKTIAP